MSSHSTAVAWGENDCGTTELVSAPSEAVFDAAQELFGRKWHLRIVYYLLEDGPLGFSALKQRLTGISSKMLSESLSTLEADGVVNRERIADSPVRVEYSLTARGQTLEPIVTAVVRWGSEHAVDGPTDDHPAKQDGNRSEGA